MLPEKILIAADGSRDSKLALRMATSMAGGLGAELHVVYVAIVSPWVMGGKLSDTEYDRLKREQQGFLDRLVQEIEGMGGELAGSHFRVGKRADDEIIKLSEELDVDLIVVGSKGQTTIARALMGSDSESIVRHSRHPVLVVRGG